MSWAPKHPENPVVAAIEFFWYLRMLADFSGPGAALLEWFLLTHGRWNEPLFEKLVGDYVERTRGVRLPVVAPPDVRWTWAFDQLNHNANWVFLKTIEVQA
jgi:hypothetical protein